MWTCAKCGEQIENQFDTCWKCSEPARPSESAGKPPWRLSFHGFRSTWASWPDLFEKAAEFATAIGPERLVSISHSEDGNEGVVTVWYWEEASGTDPERPHVESV